MAFDGRPVGQHIAGIINDQVNKTPRQAYGPIRLRGFHRREVSEPFQGHLRGGMGAWRGWTVLSVARVHRPRPLKECFVEVFGRLYTMATIYNYPYYPEHLSALNM